MERGKIKWNKSKHIDASCSGKLLILEVTKKI